MCYKIIKIKTVTKCRRHFTLFIYNCVLYLHLFIIILHDTSIIFIKEKKNELYFFLFHFMALCLDFSLPHYFISFQDSYPKRN